MDARLRVRARRAAFLNSFPSPFAGRAKETKQQAHREKETPDVRKFTHAIFFSKPRADDQVGALRVRCTARPSSVGGARRCTNAFSRCGLSLHAGCPPLLCGTAWHSVSTACRIQARAMSGAHDIPLRLRDEFSSTRYERHGMAFRFSTACRIQARVARTTWLRLAHAKSGPQQLLRTPKCALAA